MFVLIIYYICSTQEINKIKKQVVKITHNLTSQNNQLQLKVLYMNLYTHTHTNKYHNIIYLRGGKIRNGR